MSKDFQEPEEKQFDNQNDEIIDDFNPLDEAVAEKEYTKHNVKVNPNDFKYNIPEPDFNPPPMTGMMTDEEKTKKPQEPFNPKMKDLPNKDKNDAAEKFAEMIMGGYKWLNSYADSRLLFDERKLMKMQMAGEVDMSIPMPLSPTTTISAGEFIQEYNQQSKGTISVSKQFEEETLPVLTRVLAKRGVGMTDEQYLAFLFGKDAITKTFLMSQSLSVKKDILNQLKEMTEAYRGQSIPKPMASQPAPQPTPQPTYTPEPEVEVEEYDYTPTPKYNPDENVNDFVGIMTGAITQDDLDNDVYYEEPKRSKKATKPTGKRGRPKKK